MPTQQRDEAERSAAALADTCRGCRHFFVTWKPDRPWGCRALGFESAERPWLVVRQSSGLDCQLFAARALWQ
jgi:hypothetical protein